LLAPATQQFTAVAKDASGAVMSRTFTWTSSATSVATVSTTGLVTAVANGAATVTAAVDGKQGVAAVTVVASTDGPVVAKADIGPTGGSVGTAEYAVTIPAGALATTATIMLVRDTVHTPNITEGAATPNYLIDGLPADRVVNVRVRIKATAPITGVAAIAVTRPSMAFSDSGDVLRLGTALVAATDSAGYLVATVPLRGRPTEWISTLSTLSTMPGLGFGGGIRTKTMASAVNPQDLKAAAELTGLIKLTRALSTAGNFEIWGIGTIASIDQRMASVGALLEQARVKVQAMGYSLDHRTTWPMQVYLMRDPDGDYGAWYVVLPFPVDPNMGYLHLNPDKMVEQWFPGTVMHEFFHFVQTGYTLGKPREQVSPVRWINEATSTWIEEKHPSQPAPFADLYSANKSSWLWTGIHADNIAKVGYGRAAFIKWLEMTQGEAKVRQMYADVRTGAVPIAAFLMAYPGASDSWMPLFLKDQLEGRIYPFWPLAALYPKNQSYSVPPKVGLLKYETVQLLALGTEGAFLVRDTARFGPDYTLTVRLDTAGAKDGVLTAFRHPLGTTKFTFVASGDSVKFPPAQLRSTDDLLVLMTNTSPTPPYTATKKLGYLIDQALPEGDLYMPSISGMNNGIRFVCDQPGDSVQFDPAENAQGVWGFFSMVGKWKKTQESPTASPFATYTWSPYPAYADSLARSGITMQSSMQVLRNDTVRVVGRFVWALNSASVRSGGVTGDPPFHGGVAIPWWSALIALAGIPLVFRKQGARRVLPMLASGVVLLLVGCSVGLISLTIDENFEYTFVKSRFVSNVPNAKTALVELQAGSGKTTIAERLVHWKYFTNTAGKPDSVRATCTGSGTATYTSGMAIYPDSVVPASALQLTPDARVTRLGKALGLDLTRAAPEIKARMR
jgi:hypothetical protein